jgi:hypothetical protein
MVDIRSVKDDWDAEAVADVRSLFLDPRAPKAMVKDAFLVQQGNIYVTQVSETHSSHDYTVDLRAS